MNKAILSFSNGDTLELFEGQRITPIARHTYEDGVGTSQCETYEIWCHWSAGMIPSITELLCRCDFFLLQDDTDKAYASASVVSIKNL